MRRADNPTTFMCRLLEIWDPQRPETVRACPGLYRDWFTFAVHGFGTWSLTLRQKLLSEADMVIRGNSLCCGHRQARSSNSAGRVSLHTYLDTSWWPTTLRHVATEEAYVPGGYSNLVTFSISAPLSAYPLWHYCCGYPHPRTAVILSTKLNIAKLRSTGTSNVVYSLPSSGSVSNYCQLRITTAIRQTVHCFDWSYGDGFVGSSRQRKTSPGFVGRSRQRKTSPFAF